MMQTALGAFEKEDFATAERTADAVLEPGSRQRCRAPTPRSRTGGGNLGG